VWRTLWGMEILPTMLPIDLLLDTLVDLILGQDIVADRASSWRSEGAGGRHREKGKEGVDAGHDVVGTRCDPGSGRLARGGMRTT
jgi:hypothetical protein